jgi:hypothetical protein
MILMMSWNKSPPLPGADMPTNPVESPAVNAFSVDGFAIEGVEGINVAHAQSFYELLIPMMQKAGPSWKLSTCQKFDSIINDDEDPLEAWFGVVEAMDESEFIELEYLSNLSLCMRVPNAWCVDTSDVHQVRSFVPAYLYRETKNMWEETDVDDMVLRNLDWTSNERIDNIIGIYIQHPAKRFIKYFKEKRPLATLTAANTHAAPLAVLPKRSALRKRAAENIAKSTSKMKACAMMKSGVNYFDVGNVVKVALVDVDRPKTDLQNLTGVIVNVNLKTMMARVVVKSGVLKNWYAYHKLTHVTGSGNNIELLGLSNSLVGCSMMATITEREATQDKSMVGGQGKGGVICSCKSACQTRACSCFKEGRRCSSACHRNNHKCKNHDKDANDDANNDDK